MAEGAAAADEEADAELFGFFEDFFVAYRAAGFNHGADSGLGRELLSSRRRGRMRRRP